MAKGIKGIVLKIGGDTTELSNSIDSAYKSTGALQTELTKVEKALKLDPKNVTLAQQKMDILKSSVTETEKKLGLLKDAQNRAAEAFAKGELSEAQYREIGRQVAEAERKLGTLKTQLGQVESKWSAVGKSMQDAGEKLTKVGDKMTTVGNGMTRGLTAPILAAGAGLTKLSVDAGKMADEMITLSTKTGISTDELQKMSYAARFIDTELETMTGSMVKLTRNMDSAREGTKKQKDAFADLGVEYQNTDGTLRDSKTVWLEAIDALGKMGNETDRDAIALNLFGKSAQELNPLIKAGSGELERYGVEAENVGAIIDTETLGSLGALDNKMQQLTAKTEVAKAELGAAFIPVLEDLTPILTETLIPALRDAAEWFGNLDEDTQKTIITVAGVAAAAGPLVSTLGTVTSTVGGLTSGIGKLMAKEGGIAGLSGLLTGPLGTVALVAAFAGALYIAYQNSTKLSEEAQKVVDGLDRAKEGYQDTSDEIRTNSEVALTLVDSLEKLRNKTDKTAGEKVKMKGIIDQLNKIYPDLNANYDEEKDLVNLTTSEIVDYVAAKKQQLELAAQEEYFTQALKDRAKALALATKAEQEYNDAVADRKSGIVKPLVNGYLPEEDAFKKMRDAQLALKTAEDAVKSAEAVYDKSAEEINKSVKKMAGDVEDGADDQIDANENLTDEQKKLYAEQVKNEEAAFKERKAVRDQYQRDFESSKQKHLSSMGGLDDLGIQKTKLTAAEIKKNLEQQILDFAAWRASIKSLAEKVPDDVMRELITLGPEMLPVIQELNGMTNTQLAEWVRVWREKSAAATQATRDELGPVPSIASDKVQGLVNAIQAKKEAARQAAANVAAAAKEGFEGTSAYGAGQSFAQGYINGISSKIPVVADTAGALARTALSTVKITQMSRSPSKLTEQLGVYFGEGYVEGIKSEIGSAKVAASDMVNGAADGLRSLSGGLDWANNPSNLDMPSVAGGGVSNVNVAQLVVREEADVKRVATELYALQKRAEMRLA